MLLSFVVEDDDEDEGDDDEDLDEAEPGFEEFIKERNLAERNSSRDLEANRALYQRLERDDDVANAVDYFKQRYSKRNEVDRFGSSDQLSNTIAQQRLLPGVNDPNMWTVRCRMGEEKATCLLLMRKYLAYQHKADKQPLLIKSIIVKEGIKGYIYVEAFKQPHVKAAIEDVSNLKMGLYKQEMVPIKEMPDVLRVMKDVVRLKQGSWVRLKRTMFKDDLAQVDSVDTAQNQVTLKLVPRIDYARKRGMHRDQQHSKDDDANNKRKRRPAQRLFDLDLIKSVGGLPTKERDSDYWIFEYNRYNQRGFLIKTFPLSAVITEGVKPTLAELQRFEDSPDGGLDVDAAVLLGKTVVDKSHNFAPGDVVEVCQGELIHLNGVVVGIDGDKIRVMPKHEELKVSRLRLCTITWHLWPIKRNPDYEHRPLKRPCQIV